MLLHMLALGGHGFEFQCLRLRQNLRTDLRGIRPRKRLFALLRLGIRMMYRQHPRTHFASHFFFVSVSGNIHHQNAVRLQPFVFRQG